jgi:chemotaxis protein methyltransferase CheR
MNNTTPGLDQDSFEFIKAMVHDRSAIVLELNKAYLIESRLMPVARQHRFESIAQLVGALRNAANRELRQAVIEAMTTHETSFFRDLHPFEALRLHVLPPLIAARGTSRTLNIWCAACSTGQEPYTIAMMLREHFPALATWNIKLLATDLSHQILEKAGEASFSQIEVNRGLPANLLVKYFQKVGLKWQLKEEIRRMVQFSTMNLAEPWPTMPRMDVVFLRNVLIYFSTETKREILGRVERLLAADGSLFLGGAETTLNLSDAFSRVNVGKTSCYQLQRAAAAKTVVSAINLREAVCSK